MLARLIAIALALGLFSGYVNASPEDEFWKWFQKNDDVLFNFENDQERVFDRLAEEMHKVDPNITFEFGPKEGNKREFVISADGIRSAFPKVEALYAAAPPLKKWKVIKFRPRREPFNIKYGGIEVLPRDVTVSIAHDGQRAGLTVFISGFTAARQKEYSSVAYLFLDQALGEYDVETKVGFVQIRGNSTIPIEAVSILDLPKTFDRFLSR